MHFYIMVCKSWNNGKKEMLKMETTKYRISKSELYDFFINYLENQIIEQQKIRGASKKGLTIPESACMDNCGSIGTEDKTQQALMKKANIRIIELSSIIKEAQSKKHFLNQTGNYVSILFSLVTAQRSCDDYEESKTYFLTPGTDCFLKGDISLIGVQTPLGEILFKKQEGDHGILTINNKKIIINIEEIH